MRCPLCGHEFDADQLSCHASCAFNSGCAVICCPNCGYQMVDESRSRLASWLRARLNRTARPAPATPVVRPLSALQPGQSGTIVSVDDAAPGRHERLSTFGLIPGATITLRQRLPAFVLRVGFTELSVEQEVAEDILVETLA